jgi:DNA repair protein RadC
MSDPCPCIRGNNANAINMIRPIVRNHPSGDPTPSQAHIQMTKAIIESATPPGISVHDHIIVGRTGMRA